MSGGRVFGVLAVAWFACAGCGDDQPIPVPGDGRRSVMLIDNGIDPALPALAGKIRATHTVECDDAVPDGGTPDGGEPDGDGGTPDGGTPDGGPTFDELKAAMLAELALPDESCRLRAGIDPKRPFASSFSRDTRDRWNDFVRSGRILSALDPFSGMIPPEQGAILEALAAELESEPFHGTATASALAHAVPYLELVLVERSLATVDDIADMACPTQQEIDQVTALYEDADVRVAYVQRPLARVDRELRALRDQHRVSLVNESFGPLSRFGLEEALFDAGCDLLSFGPFFSALGELEHAREQNHPEPGVLFVRAAGNSSSALNDSMDTLQCRPGEPHQILVGSYGVRGRRSFFTNFGPCVDVFAPGEDIVVATPGDWLLPVDGTSFAAPLVARLLLFEAPTPFSSEGARAALLALREPNRNIPRFFFPSDLALDRVALAQQSGALSVRRSGLLAASDRLPGPSLRDALWPLRWLRRQR